MAELYTDVHRQYRDIQNKRFKSIALPLYVIVGPDGHERTRLAGRITTEQFLGFLNKGKSETSLGPPTFRSAVAKATVSKRPLLVRFSDVTGSLSVEQSERVLKSPRVRGILDSFEEVELWADMDKEARTLLHDRFKTAALPTYVILGPGGVEHSKLSGKRSESEVVAFLEKGLGR